MKVGVIGSGAMGTIFGLAMARSGDDVLFYDVRPDLIATIEEDGLRLRPCENPANFCKQSRRAKFFAIFSLPSGLRARKSEQNRSVSKRVGVFTQARPRADIPPIARGYVWSRPMSARNWVRA